MTLNILVVEDDYSKRQRIVSAIKSGDSTASIVEAVAIIEARQLLTDKSYDLLILDIALPTYPDEAVVRDAGAGLLREIQDYDVYPKPKYVIGVTGYRDLSDMFDVDFEKRFWRLLYADNASNEWQESISKFVKHLSKVSRQVDQTSVVDVCLLTALHEPEFEAILELPWNWQGPMQLDQSTFYRLGHFFVGQRIVTVAAGCALRMGPVPASVLACKFVSTFRPSILGLAGICAGVKGAVELGDIVAASEVWSWESGKHIGADRDSFSPEPTAVAVPENVIACLQQLQQNRSWLDSVKASYKGLKPGNSLNLKISPMASGSPVVADSNLVTRICSVNRKTAAIEMEAFGTLMAARSWSGRVPAAFCVKSVCDFADEHKNDDWRAYAAFTSAQTIRELLEKHGDGLIPDA